MILQVATTDGEDKVSDNMFEYCCSLFKYYLLTHKETEIELLIKTLRKATLQ